MRLFFSMAGNKLGVSSFLNAWNELVSKIRPLVFYKSLYLKIKNINFVHTFHKSTKLGKISTSNLAVVMCYWAKLGIGMICL